jgi:hypothetical protein
MEVDTIVEVLDWVEQQLIENRIVTEELVCGEPTIFKE